MHAVLQAQNHRLGIGPIKTCNSVTKIYVLHAKTAHENWEKNETSNSGANNAVLCALNYR